MWPVKKVFYIPLLLPPLPLMGGVPVHSEFAEADLILTTVGALVSDLSSSYGGYTKQHSIYFFFFFLMLPSGYVE